MTRSALVILVLLGTALMSGCAATAPTATPEATPVVETPTPDPFDPLATPLPRVGITCEDLPSVEEIASVIRQPLTLSSNEAGLLDNTWPGAIWNQQAGALHCVWDSETRGDWYYYGLELIVFPKGFDDEHPIPVPLDPALEPFTGDPSAEGCIPELGQCRSALVIQDRMVWTRTQEAPEGSDPARTAAFLVSFHQALDVALAGAIDEPARPSSPVTLLPSGCSPIVPYMAGAWLDFAYSSGDTGMSRVCESSDLGLGSYRVHVIDGGVWVTEGYKAVPPSEPRYARGLDSSMTPVAINGTDVAYLKCTADTGECVAIASIGLDLVFIYYTGEESDVAKPAAILAEVFAAQ